MGNIIRFDTGVVEYNINDAVTVYINPTDLSFVERVFATFDAMDAKQEAYNAAIEAEKDTAGIFRIAYDDMADLCACGRTSCWPSSTRWTWPSPGRKRPRTPASRSTPRSIKDVGSDHKGGDLSALFLNYELWIACDGGDRWGGSAHPH